MAAPQKPPLPKVLMATDGKDKKIETDIFRRKTITIGRDADCEVVLKDPKASRKHCRLTRGEGGFMLEDLGSKNGTFVDGKKITEPMPLKATQTFKVGDTVLYLS